MADIIEVDSLGPCLRARIEVRAVTGRVDLTIDGGTGAIEYQLTPGEAMRFADELWLSARLAREATEREN